MCTCLPGISRGTQIKLYRRGWCSWCSQLSGVGNHFSLKSILWRNRRKVPRGCLAYCTEDFDLLSDCDLAAVIWFLAVVLPSDQSHTGYRFKSTHFSAPWSLSDLSLHYLSLLYLSTHSCLLLFWNVKNVKIHT